MKSRGRPAQTLRVKRLGAAASVIHEKAKPGGVDLRVYKPFIWAYEKFKKGQFCKFFEGSD